MQKIQVRLLQKTLHGKAGEIVDVHTERAAKAMVEKGVAEWPGEIPTPELPAPEAEPEVNLLQDIETETQTNSATPELPAPEADTNQSKKDEKDSQRGRGGRNAADHK